MLNNLKLGTKLNILLISLFVVVVVIGGGFLSFVLERNAEQVVTDQALLLIETMSSVRHYTSTQINPELAPRLETEAKFLPQTVPAYSAREVFEDLRKQDEYKDFFYTEATLNPTNLRDKADNFGTRIVDKFKADPTLKEQTGFRSDPGGSIFYIARPIKIAEESCLRCHGKPSEAPKSLLVTYGDKNGFGWKVGDIIGAKMISVPATTVLETARNLKISVIGILGLFLLLALIAINFFLKKTITTPIIKMSQLAQRVSTGDLSGEFKHPSNDEVGLLATSLNRMKVSLEIAMNMLNSEIE
jgi:HAMP domain-containing protein